jgi:hypothetical protein
MQSGLLKDTGYLQFFSQVKSRKYAHECDSLQSMVYDNILPINELLYDQLPKIMAIPV